MICEGLESSWGASRKRQVFLLNFSNHTFALDRRIPFLVPKSTGHDNFQLLEDQNIQKEGSPIDVNSNWFFEPSKNLVLVHCPKIEVKTSVVNKPAFKLWPFVEILNMFNYSIVTI